MSEPLFSPVLGRHYTAALSTSRERGVVKASALARVLRACCCPHGLGTRLSDLRATESGEITQALVGDKPAVSCINSHAAGTADGRGGGGEGGDGRCMHDGDADTGSLDFGSTALSAMVTRKTVDVMEVKLVASDSLVSLV